jgi:hypothetical protein
MGRGVVAATLLAVDLAAGAAHAGGADAPLVDLASNRAEPIVDDGTIEPPGPRPAGATTECKPLATAPSFYVVADKAQSIELRMVWQRRAQWFLVEGPGVSTCSAGGDPVSFDASAGRYAVWAGGTPGADFHVLVHRADADVDPLTAFGTPPADLEIAERVLTHFYPYFALGADDASAKTAASALFASISDRLIVYVDAQPLAVLAVDKHNAQVLTVEGHVARVPMSAIALERPARAEVPGDAGAAIAQHLGATPVAIERALPRPVEVSDAQWDAPPPIASAHPPPRAALHERDDAAPVPEPMPSGRLDLEVGITSPRTSTAGNLPRGNAAQGIGLDARVAHDVFGGVQLGGELSLAQWSNYPTEYLGQANHLYRAGAFARYELMRGRLRPYAMIDVDAGLSSLTSGFTIYDAVITGRTMIADPSGFAFTYGAGVGFERTLYGPWSIVGEVAGRRTTLYHSLSFTDGGTGATSSIDHITLDELDAHFAIGYGF